MDEETNREVDMPIIEKSLAMLWDNIQDNPKAAEENGKWLTKFVVFLGKLQTLLFPASGKLGSGWATQEQIANLIAMLTDEENVMFEDLRDAGAKAQQGIAENSCGLYELYAGCSSHDVM